jgi:retron-type reverse transcriptase
MNAEFGLPLGSILSPVLLNVNLEEALKSSKNLRRFRKEETYWPLQMTCL